MSIRFNNFDFSLDTKVSLIEVNGKYIYTPSTSLTLNINLRENFELNDELEFIRYQGIDYSNIKLIYLATTNTSNLYRQPIMLIGDEYCNTLSIGIEVQDSFIGHIYNQIKSIKENINSYFSLQLNFQYLSIYKEMTEYESNSSILDLDKIVKYIPFKFERKLNISHIGLTEVSEVVVISSINLLVY